MLNIKNTQKDYEDVAKIVMLAYGAGGVGKTTFASTFPKPLLLDFENGAKYFKQRGIDIDVIQVQDWFTIEDKKQLAELVKNYETIVFDPIGEAMEKLMHSETISGSKYRQSDGSLSIAGWGKVKDDFRALMKWARDLDKHVLLLAHVDEKEDEQSLVKRPKIATKISDEIVAMVDIVGYMEIVNVDGLEKRVLRVQPTEKYYAKDRTGTLDKFVKPEFAYIADQIKSRQAEEIATVVDENAQLETEESDGDVDLGNQLDVNGEPVLEDTATPPDWEDEEENHDAVLDETHDAPTKTVTKKITKKPKQV